MQQPEARPGEGSGRAQGREAASAKALGQKESGVEDRDLEAGRAWRRRGRATARTRAAERLPPSVPSVSGGQERSVPPALCVGCEMEQLLRETES